MMRLVPLLAAVLLSSGFSAYAGDEKPAEATPAAARPDRASGGDCMFSRTISSWQVLDNETLIIWAPTRKNPHVVKLWRPVFGLKSEFTLGFQDGNNDGQFCDYGRDAIVVDGPAGPERYSIRSIRRVEEAEAKELLAASREKKKEQPAVAMPEQSDMKSDKKSDQKSDQKNET